MNFFFSATLQERTKVESSRIIAEGLSLVTSVMALHSGDGAVISKGCNVLRNVCVLGHKVQAVNANALPQVMAAIEHFPNNSKVQEHALAVLWSLVTENETRKATLAFDVVSISLRSLWINGTDSAVVNMAVGTIRGVCYDDIPMQDALIKLDGISVIAGALQRFIHKSNIVIECVLVLYFISKTSSFRPLFTSFKVLPTMVNVLREYPKHSEIQNWALSVLWNCTVDVDGCAAVAADIDVVVASMHYFSDNADIQEDCLNILWNLAFHKVGVDKMKTNEVIELTKRAVRMHDKLKAKGQHLLKILNSGACVVM